MFQMDAVIFGSGVTLGALITWWGRGVEIERALDTVGIKRKEHTRLKKDVEALEIEVEALNEKMRMFSIRLGK